MKRKMPDLKIVKDNNVPIKYFRIVKYLGVMLDRTLKYIEQIKNILMQTSGALC